MKFFSFSYQFNNTMIFFPQIPTSTQIKWTEIVYQEHITIDVLISNTFYITHNDDDNNIVNIAYYIY